MLTRCHLKEKAAHVQPKLSMTSQLQSQATRFHNYHVFTCSLGKVDCSHANNTINGLICVILYLPVVAVFLRENLKIVPMTIY